MIQKKTIIENLNKIKNELDNTEDGIVRRNILDYIISYFSFLRKNEQLKEFTKNIAHCFNNNNSIVYVLIRFEEINDLLLKYFIDIPKIFENKKYLECCFKLTLLSQNNNNFIYNIKNLLDFNDEKALKIIEKNVSIIDYSNPFSIIYLH